jgi:large subunit ribosomal protein L21
VAEAIIQTGGKQFRVKEGEVLQVPALARETGSSVEFQALALIEDQRFEFGTPILDGVSVQATVLGHGRGPKIIVFKKKRRKQYRKKQGHRQGFTTVRIDRIARS